VHLCVVSVCTTEQRHLISGLATQTCSQQADKIHPPQHDHAAAASKQARAVHLCQPAVDALCQQCRNTYGRHLEACDGFVFNHRDTCVPDLLKGSKDLKAPVKIIGFQARTGVITRGLMSFYQTYRKALHLNVNMRLAVLSLLPDRADRTDAKCTTRTGFGAFTAAWGR